MRGSIFAIFIVLGLTLSACGGNGTNQQPDPTEPPSAPDGVIQGTILSASGDPVVDAQVVLQQTGIAVSALSAQAVGLGTTDSAGQFGVDVPSAGTYSLVMVQNGLGVHTTVGVVEQAGGLTASELDLTATAVGAVEGHVVYPDGSDAVNVLVFLEGTSFLALTDTTGGFVISGVPASPYALVAKEGTYSSGGTPVSVASGTTTSIPSDIQLVESVDGPVITSTNPTGPQAIDPVLLRDGVTVTINGSGFGSAKNNSLLLYNGVALPTTSSIVSWSDNEIVVQWWPLHAGPTGAMHLEDARYEVATIKGSAVSDPVALYYIYAYSYMVDISQVGIPVAAATLSEYGSGPRLQGVEFNFSTTSGTLNATSVVTSSEGSFDLALTPANLLPHFVTVSSGGMSQTLIVVCCQGSSLQGWEYVPDVESTIQGIVRANDYATPVPNATGLTFVIVVRDDATYDELGEAFRTPITTDANGEFSVLATLPALPSGQIYDTYLEYQSERVGSPGGLLPAP